MNSLFQGKPFTSIEPGTNLNNMCILPNSGLMFLAHEAPKMLTYYIPVSCIVLYLPTYQPII